MLNDVRIALRTLARRPGFSLAAIVTLALGIGANTAVFTVVQSVLLRPLPYPEPDRLVMIRTVRPDVPFPNTVFSQPRVDAWASAATTFSQITSYAGSAMTVTGDGDPARLRVTRVLPQFFQVLGAPPLLGGYFAPQQTGVVVLSHRLWRSRYSSRPDVVGSTVRLDGLAFEVVGVAPSALTFPADPDAWVPLVLTEAERDQRRAFLTVIGRVRPGIRLYDADAELERIAGIAPGPAEWRPAGRENGAAPARPRISTVTLLEQEVGAVRPRILIVAGAVTLVLLIACVNVANLLLARGIGRRGEVAIRAALGAGRGRLVRQLVTESVVLSVAGGWLGVLLAVWLVRVLVRLAPADIRRIDEIAIDPAVLAFAAGLALTAGLVAGLVPALQSLRAELSDGLRQSRKGLAVGRSQRAQSVLVGLEVTLTVVLLVSGLLLAGSFVKLTSVETGLDADDVLAFDVSLPSARYPGDVRHRQFVDAALENLRSIPGVQTASAALAPPFSGWNFALAVHAAGGGTFSPLYQSVSGQYFEGLGIRLEAGRYLTDSDVSGGSRVAVISRSLGTGLWAGAPAVGRTLRLGPATAPESPEVEIVGVVGDVLHGSLSASPVPTLYLPVRQRSSALLTLMVRSVAGSETLATAVRERMAMVDPDLPLQNLTPMTRRIARTTDQARFYTLVLGTFAMMAIVLAVVGVYGLVVYFVGERTHELGVHLALGATSTDVIALVLRTGLRPVLAGLVCGALLSAVVTRSMRELLFQVAPGDPRLLAAGAALVLAAAAVACYVPARRAARLDPSVALRAE